MEPTYPGVYNVDVAGAPSPIRGVAAAIYALVGWTPRGPSFSRSSSFPEFIRKHGDFNAESNLHHQASLFFQNGGRDLVTVRVVGANAANAIARTSLPASGSAGTGNTVLVTFTGTFAGAPLVPGSVSVSDGVETFTDNGVGVLVGSASGTGTINYETGAYSVTFNAAPAAAPIPATWRIYQWGFALKWAGVLGNDYSIRIAGLPGTETDEATFTRWTVSLLLDDVVVEQYGNVDFDDPESPRWVASVINDSKTGSTVFEVIDYGPGGAPEGLIGVEVEDENIGTGNGTITEFTVTLDEGSAYPGSLVISTLNTVDAVMTVTDDRFGSLTGSVNPIGDNEIDYDSGEISVTFNAAVKNAAAVLASYFTKPEDSITIEMSGGLDGDPVTSADIIDPTLEADRLGMWGLDKTDDLLLVSIPDFTGIAAVDQALLDYCAARGDRTAILGVPVFQSEIAERVVDYKNRVLARNANSYGAIYWPNVDVTDPVSRLTVSVPPVGVVAGLVSRANASRGLYKAPAGVIDGDIRGILGLSYSPTKADVGRVNAAHVNALIDWREVGGQKVWGARTLELNGDFPYLSWRLVMQFVQRSVYDAVQREVFEPNTTGLWVSLRTRIGSFLTRLTNQGWFASSKPAEAFFVVVDETNNPPETVALGQVHVDVGIAFSAPAEFVIIRYSRKTT